MTTNLDSDELLTQEDLQNLLGVSRTTVWRLRRESGLPFGRVGRQYRYRKSEVLHWLRDARYRDPQLRLGLRIGGSK
jgi:excisionase family DNA binding protein